MPPNPDPLVRRHSGMTTPLAWEKKIKGLVCCWRDRRKIRNIAPMTRENFESSISEQEPPVGLTPLLEALWYDAKGDWQHAHNIAQDVQTDNGSWMHAYLHRKEGDLGNAAYWYRRAGRPVSTISLEQEWKQIADVLLRV